MLLISKEKKRKILMQKNKEGKSLQEYSIKAAVDIIADANVALQKLHHPKG